MEIEERKGLVSLEDRYPLGPPGQAIRGDFIPVKDGEYRVFWGRSKDLRYTIEAVAGTNGDRKEEREDRTEYQRQAGHLLLATRFDTTFWESYWRFFHNNRRIGFNVGTSTGGVHVS